MSLTEVNAVKWACLYLQALCALLAIAFVHCDDRLSSLLAMGLFATGVSASVLLIAAHDRPFVGEVAVTPKPLLQIVSALQIIPLMTRCERWSVRNWRTQPRFQMFLTFNLQ